MIEVGSQLEKITLNNVKEKANFYQSEALSQPNVSDETNFEVKKALSKHAQPIPCPICKELMKNERGVKLHIAKKHK